ncbi:hypothetical protein BOTBODRAFT_63227 [Botryobasidium botryosum FD-172 SS1]|uniref:RNA polymerase III subunit Rpc25 domain-containing protein n=1 Tax=Botryobasidium botryosum (strain FD-172 SS1) TaxID=930990 RepID=A0A067MTM7_BOTB1|nr:hypothetical protein BOTBODRAFT_63227 [Botryobasidium botryosum FD-172 SS1]
MYNLALMKDTVALRPNTFGSPPHIAILEELNKKYANRVVHDVGLAICVFDLVEAGEGKVRYGDGCLWYKITFRLVVFRPFRSEIIVAQVKSNSEEAVRLTLEFFDDIYIPVAYLPHPHAFDPNDRQHFWVPDRTTEELLDEPLPQRNYLEAGEYIRVRVESDEFYDDEPGPPKVIEGVAVQDDTYRRPPYRIICSIAEAGLGLISWWDGSRGGGAMDLDEEEG